MFHCSVEHVIWSPFTLVIIVCYNQRTSFLVLQRFEQNQRLLDIHLGTWPVRSYRRHSMVCFPALSMSLVHPDIPYNLETSRGMDYNVRENIYWLRSHLQRNENSKLSHINKFKLKLSNSIGRVFFRDQDFFYLIFHNYFLFYLYIPAIPPPTPNQYNHTFIADCP